MKSPFNWVGNKIKYIDKINELIRDKEYDIIYDCFMGSGNIIFNINNDSTLIGMDEIPLLVNIYQFLSLKKYKRSSILKHFRGEVELYNNFTTKEDYYTFRCLWNKDYKAHNINLNFVVRTLILTKLCSNSMVRFNSKGEFNQGFRGSKAWFNENNINKLTSELKSLNDFLYYKEIKFINTNSLTFKYEKGNNLLICDPPYVFKKSMYNNNYEGEASIIDILSKHKGDFILFNTLERNNESYEEILKWVESHKYRVIVLRDQIIFTGQKSKGCYNLEVMITNIKE